MLSQPILFTVLKNDNSKVSDVLALLHLPCKMRIFFPSFRHVIELVFDRFTRYALPFLV